MIWDAHPIYADMAELVDALSSDGSGYAVRVRLSLSAPMECIRTKCLLQVFCSFYLKSLN